MSKLEQARIIAREKQTASGRRLGLQSAHAATLPCSDMHEMRQSLMSLASRFAPPPPKAAPPSSHSEDPSLLADTLAQIASFKSSIANLRAHPPRLSDDEIAAELARFGRV